MTTLLFFIGIGLAVAGVAMWNVPAAFVVAGVSLAAFAVSLERGQGGVTGEPAQ